ncbi:MFS transporter, PCFT/HCP family, solute carrier family 46 (folate transporter), member 1/3 [Mytilus galloprovincialis]|uniref:MFS transporter, PCFT/HCP family, solute carrier family 46 (Folate transporter), member 1/3 n=1 Tax=Mytilus galloprovincialis TaxID=29158 RepID=A0A8B6E843_MYTGA|nr:MFS transporter, PCFT/HCP family, solute carrier family 46 (folate transporter), member 1/3 [Mytilus galloprovincialis]
MSKTENLEEKPLLHSNKLEFVKLKYPRWLTYSVVIAIPLCHILSFMLSLFLLNQYTYYKFMKQEYPNASDTSEKLPTCTTNTSTVGYQQQVAVQKISAEWSMICSLSYIIPGMFSNINLATYSDVYGRKLFFIIPLAGSMLKSALCAIGIYYEIDVRYLLFFYMIEVCTGSWFGTLSMSLCFIADTTEEGKDRSILIGLLEGGLGIGAFIGTFISGYLISLTDGFFYPDVIASCVVSTGLLLALTMIQESLPESRKRKHVSPLDNMKRVFECYSSDFSPKGKRWMFIILIFIFSMSAISNLSRHNVETLYELNTPFCWDSVKIGVYSSIRICFFNLGAVIIIKVFHFCSSDEVIALAGCFTTLASLILEGLAQSDLMMYLSAAASLGCIVTMPMSRSIMSRMTPANKQGSVFAGVAAVELLCALVGGLLMNGIYKATVDVYRGMVFLIWAAFSVVGIILCLILIKGKRRGKLEFKQEETTIKVEFTASGKK